MAQPIAYGTSAGVNTPVEVTPDTPLPTTSAVVGAIDDAAETNPAEDATVIALLKGILTELQLQTALLTDIEINTSP